MYTFELKSGLLFERRNGDVGIVVEFSDLGFVIMDETGNVQDVLNQYEAGGLNKDNQRLLDFVRVWDVPVSANLNFMDFSQAFREVLWEGNLIPAITVSEYVILENLEKKFSDYVFYNNDGDIYLVTVYIADLIDKNQVFDLGEYDQYDDVLRLPFETPFKTLLTEGQISNYTVAEFIAFNDTY